MSSGMEFPKSTSDDSALPSGAAFEREKWRGEMRLREREVAVKEQEAAIKQAEQQTRAKEIAFTQAEAAWSKWTNPLVVAIFAAAIAAGGNAVVAYINGAAQRQAEETKSRGEREIEASKAESTRILEVIKTGNIELAKVNLKFLLDTGLIADRQRRTDLSAYLERAKPGEGPTLPSAQRLPCRQCLIQSPVRSRQTLMSQS
jgi:hypothetical protein